MNKYVSAFIGGMVGAVLGVVLTWFVVLDPNAPVYTFISSLPQSFQELATDVFVFFGLVASASIVFYCARMGYLSATKEGRVKLDAEREKHRADKIENLFYTHGMRYAWGLIAFMLVVIVYEIVADAAENLIVAILFLIFIYVFGYAARRLWQLTWGPKMRAKLDAWKRNEKA